MPGHGPVTDLAGVREIRAYHGTAMGKRSVSRRVWIWRLQRQRPLDRWADWGEPERIVTPLDTCFREFSGRSAQPRG